MHEEVISTRETPGPFDGFERAKVGEPIFTLQGGDPLGAPLVILWAALARMRAGVGLPDPALWARILHAVGDNIAEPNKAEGLLLRATEAEAISWAMDEYRKGEAAEPGASESYSGVELGAEAIAQQEESAAKIAAGRKLDNAVAESLEAAAVARRYGLGQTAESIESLVGYLREASEQIRPMRSIARGAD